MTTTTLSPNNPDLLVCVACGTEFDQPADRPLDNCVICDVRLISYCTLSLSCLISHHNSSQTHSRQYKSSSTRQTNKTYKLTTKTTTGPTPIRPPNRPILDLPLPTIAQVHHHLDPPQLPKLLHNQLPLPNHHPQIRHRPTRNPHPNPLPRQHPLGLPHPARRRHRQPHKIPRRPRRYRD